MAKLGLSLLAFVAFLVSTSKGQEDHPLRVASMLVSVKNAKNAVIHLDGIGETIAEA